jgi:hypothetical protein
MSKRKHTPHQINGQFVPLLLNTIDSSPWQAMSHGAKMLYIALKRRYNATTDNNGKIYLPQRVAEKELHSKRDQIVRWFRELQHYGFIVITAPGHLGVNGRGRAPSFRLTELPYLGQPPTREFTRWNGAPFSNQKTESRSGKRDHPGPENGTKVVRKTGPSDFFPWSRKGDQALGPANGTKSRFI